MTLPLSHQNGAPVRHAFSISKNQIVDNRSKAEFLPEIGKSVSDDRERFKAIFEVGSSARVILDDDLNVIDLNTRFKNMLGVELPAGYSKLTLDETNLFKDYTLRDLRNKLPRLDIRKNLQMLADIRSDKGLGNAQISVACYNYPDATKKRYIMDINDITELEQNKTGWSESRLQLAKQDAEFKKLAKVVSHDLRGPVTNISNLIGLLESTEDAMVDPELVAGLKTSVSAILAKLDDSGSQLNTHLQQLSGGKSETIGNSISKVLEILQMENSEIRGKLRFEAYDTSDWGISEELLRMVLSQLISNSYKYRNPDKEIEINITAFKQDGQRILRVTDNGLGINIKGQGQRLFGLFQTFHKHPEARGVGLFQVKNRMKSIGGDVLLESEAGVGTTVSLNFN